MALDNNDQIVMSAISLFANRLLQDQNGTSAAETSPPSQTETTPPTKAATAPPMESDDKTFLDTTGGLDEEEAQSLFEILVLAGIIILLLVLGCKFYRRWKIRREQYELQVQSARADNVLGDMQMIGSDEYYDDDPELL